MQSHAPAILTLRQSSVARRVTSEWRAVIDGLLFEIKEDPRPAADRAWLEALVEAGR